MPESTLLPILNTPEYLNPDAASPAPFATAGEAWLWAVEVLRSRRLPSSAPMWRDAAPAPKGWHETPTALNLMAEATQVAESWGGRFKANLPHDAEGRYALAQVVQAAVMALRAEEAKLLSLWAWGDWADEARLRTALIMQEKARRDGLRVRLSYRYSAAQLGVVMGLSKATAWRKLNEALNALAGELVQRRLLESLPKAPRRDAEQPSQRQVQRREFQQR